MFQNLFLAFSLHFDRLELQLQLFEHYVAVADRDLLFGG